jgi:hypothetical protein
MSIGKAIAIWAALVIAGAGGGWAARGRYDRKSMEAIATQALMVDMSSGQFRTQTTKFITGPEWPPTQEDRDAELRCVVYDPEAIALPATIQEVNRNGDFTSTVYELQLATARGAFSIDWRGGKVPKAGQTGELLGRIADNHPLAGPVTQLEPGWFEPTGTIERVRHAKIPSHGADACGALSPKACWEKGTALLARSPEEERLAIPLLDAACARGNAEACSNLGGVFTGPTDPGLLDGRRALDAYTRGCELGDYMACCGGGEVLADGSRPVTKDFGAAARLFRVGCEHEEMICCVLLGNLYLTGGPGLPKNKKSADTYYRKAHKLGYREDQDGD